MNIRMDFNLKNKLDQARIVFDLSIPEICKKANNKYKRLKPELEIGDGYNADCGPVTVPNLGYDANTYRAILKWFLNHPDNSIEKCFDLIKDSITPKDRNGRTYRVGDKVKINHWVTVKIYKIDYNERKVEFEGKYSALSFEDYYLKKYEIVD